MAADDGGNMDSNFSEEKLMKIEAQAAVREISFAVEFVEISTKLPNTDERAYMNIRTKEGTKFCVELTVQGYRIVGSQFDNTDDTTDVSDSIFYETIYALLDQHSPKYRLTFGETLAGKLQCLQQVQGNEETTEVQ
ncbi:GSK3-beta interaction protein-like [Amphiura filiformis]|uniref:GSK3-beta interaction protein-like n=1 Tax=Amphiura filiformis TaxID=82378 RepID=UPI003B228297